MIDRTGARYRRSEAALSRRVGLDVLVTSPGDDDVHELAGGAAAVWLGLETPRTLDELVDQIASRYEVVVPDLAAQVRACIASLIELGVVRERG